MGEPVDAEGAVMAASQEDYDVGYEEGRASRQSEIDSERQRADWAREDLQRERAEVWRLRNLLHPARTETDNEFPF